MRRVTFWPQIERWLRIWALIDPYQPKLSALWSFTDNGWYFESMHISWLIVKDLRAKSDSLAPNWTLITRHISWFIVTDWRAINVMAWPKLDADYEYELVFTLPEPNCQFYAHLLTMTNNSSRVYNYWITCEKWWSDPKLNGGYEYELIFTPTNPKYSF